MFEWDDREAGQSGEDRVREAEWDSRVDLGRRRPVTFAGLDCFALESEHDVASCVAAGASVGGRKAR